MLNIEQIYTYAMQQVHNGVIEALSGNLRSRDIVYGRHGTMTRPATHHLSITMFNLQPISSDSLIVLPMDKTVLPFLFFAA